MLRFIKEDLQSPLSIFSFFIITSLFGLVGFWLKPELLSLETKKKSHLHYDFVTIIAKPKTAPLRKFGQPQADSSKGGSLSVRETGLSNGAALQYREYVDSKLCAQVYRDGIPVETVGRRRYVILDYNENGRIWKGRWPVPWNAPEDFYEVRLIKPSIINGQKIQSNSTYFRIERRKSPKMPPVIAALTYENTRPLDSLRIRGPDGKRGNWKKILDWAEEIGANHFLFLSGQTSSFETKLEEDFPWNPVNLHMIKEIAKESHLRDLKCGPWIACYFTVGSKKLLPSYNYAWEYNFYSDRMYKSRGISISDKKRVRDIVKFIREINTIPEIDYIGLDFIRTTNGGYELVDAFIEEMGVRTPSGWEKLSKAERMKWLARMVTYRNREDIPVIDMWNWWRARQICLIIKEIKKHSGITKPLWAFILSWEKGWQHGQDTVMFTDAGIDFFTVMLYEATRIQFERLIKEWNRYIKKDQANLVVGNEIDWPLHQFTKNPAGPEEFRLRLLGGVKEIYNDGSTDGAFLHDLSRALWGRKGPYPLSEWLYAGASVFTELYKNKGFIPVETQIMMPNEVDAFEQFDVKVAIKNISEYPHLTGRVTILTRDAQAKGPIEKEFSLNNATSSVIINFTLTPKIENIFKGKRNMLVVKTFCNNLDRKNIQRTRYDCKWFNIIPTDEYKEWISIALLGRIKKKLKKHFNIFTPFYYTYEDEKGFEGLADFALRIGIKIKHIPYIHNEVYSKL